MKAYSYQGSEQIMVGENNKYWVTIESGDFHESMMKIRINENKEYTDTGSYGSPGIVPLPKYTYLEFTRIDAPKFSDKLTEYVITIWGIKPQDKNNCLTISKIEMTGNDNTHLFYMPLGEMDGYCKTKLEKKFEFYKKYKDLDFFKNRNP